MSNIFTQFQSLLPSTSLTVVTVNTINNDGTSSVTTLSGTDIIVSGDSVQVGQKAFVRNGEIVRKAPDLEIGQFFV